VVIDVHDNADALVLDLGAGQPVRLAREQIDRADLRLAYVQHPFPAQGQTTDTAHLIVSEHATQEGTYVAITRGRNQTRLYASLQQLGDPEDPIVALADHVGRSEPEIPSIDTPLAHASWVSHQQAHERSAGGPRAPDEHEQPRRQPAGREPEAEGWVAALGPPPTANDPALGAWERAADTVRRYRREYHIAPDQPTALGPAPPPGAFQQRLDHRHAADSVRDALAQLDRPPHPGLELDDARHLDAGRNDRDRATEHPGPGWEP
jgi:hypothetical protein